MLVGRVVQAACGVGSFVLLARTLGAESYGEILAALAIPALLGSVLGEALSDAEVVSGGSSGVRRSVNRGVIGLSILLAAIVAVLPVPTELLLSVLAGGAFVSVTVVAAPRLAHSRRTGNARGIASANAAGSFVAVAAVLVLITLGVRDWPFFLFVFTLQPLALLFLPRPPQAVEGMPTMQALRHLWHTAGPFVASQAAWPFISQLNILVLRVLVGAEAVGIYGAMLRIVDFLGIIAPMIGIFALPTFAAARELPAAVYSHTVGRINVLVGCVSVGLLAVGIQFGWLVWSIVYPGTAFPSTIFVIIAAGASISAACGLPDRVLQGAGNARTVAVAALVAAAAFVPLSVLLTTWWGVAGASAAWLIVMGGVNLGLIRVSGIDDRARHRHFVLITMGVVASWATLVSQLSVAYTLLVSSGAAAGILVLAVLEFRGEVSTALPLVRPLEVCSSDLAGARETE
jgi:O-antigen/teichoic acid export membrane protein